MTHVPRSAAASGKWIKSSYSQASACVELNGFGSGIVGVRDSKLGSESPVLTFGANEIRAFLEGAKAGEFDYLIS